MCAQDVISDMHNWLTPLPIKDTLKLVNQNII